VSAGLARKFGTGLQTAATGIRHEINFKSYDRFCPGQDIMPKGGLGNLIALPLQKEARIWGPGGLSTWSGACRPSDVFVNRDPMIVHIRQVLDSC
jgi:hypothetical protein